VVLVEGVGGAIVPGLKAADVIKRLRRDWAQKQAVRELHQK